MRFPPLGGRREGFLRQAFTLDYQGYHSSRNPTLPRPEAGIAQGLGLHDLFRTPMVTAPTKVAVIRDWGLEKNIYSMSWLGITAINQL